MRVIYIPLLCIRAANLPMFRYWPKHAAMHWNRPDLPMNLAGNRATLPLVGRVGRPQVVPHERQLTEFSSNCLLATSKIQGVL